MTAYAFDGASSFSLDAAKRAGGIVATVYIVGTPGGLPHADAARVAAIRSAGLGVLPNWERTAGFFGNCTVAEAQAAGAEALQACKSLGFPADGSIGVPFSFDFDIPAYRFPEMLRKLYAVQKGLTSAYRACAYGQQGLIDYLAGHGWPGKHWLMMSTFGHSYDAADSHAFMVQEHMSTGAWLDTPVNGTDINTVLDPHGLAAWWPPGSPYASTTTGDEAEEMALSKQAEAQVTQIVAAQFSRFFSTVGADGKLHDHSALSLMNQSTAAHAAVQAQQTAAAALARVAQLQAANAALSKKLDALTKAGPAGDVQVTPVTVPVTGTLTVGGTK